MSTRGYVGKLQGCALVKRLFEILNPGVVPYLEQRPPTKSKLTNNSIPHIIMTAEGTWNPRIIDDHETVEEMMKRFPPTDMEATDLFYTETGDIDHNHILNNYQADTGSMESMEAMNSMK